MESIEWLPRLTVATIVERDGRTLEIWGVIDGRAGVAGLPLAAVQFTLLPAALGPFSVTSAAGAVCLRCYVE